MGGNPRKQPFWQPVVNKIKRRLTKWKGTHLLLKNDDSNNTNNNINMK